MCMRVTCEKCAKPTYAGCGRHIEAVLGDVPDAERCHCREKKGGTDVSAAPSVLRRLFGL